MRLRSSVRPARLHDILPPAPLRSLDSLTHTGAETDGANGSNHRTPNIVGDGVDPAIVVATDPGGAVARQMREARAMVLGSSDLRDDRVPILVFAGGVDSQLTPTIAANFAVASAQLGYRVLLVDAVFGAPAQHRLFRRDNGPGLGDLIGTGEPPACPATAIAGLSVMTAGDADALADGLIERSSVSQSLHHVTRAFDLIVVDAGAGEPSVIAATAAGTRGVIVVVEKHRSAVSKLQALIDGLAARSVPLLGSIIVG